MQSTETQTLQKKVISQAEFDKKVEIEVCHLMYFEYMKKDEAFSKAEQSVLADFQIL